MAIFEHIKSQINSGGKVEAEEIYRFDYSNDTETPPVQLLSCESVADKAFPVLPPNNDSGKLNFQASNSDIQAFVENHYRILLDSIAPLEVKVELDKTRLT